MNELDNPVVEGPKPEEPAQPVLPAAILPPQQSGATSNDLEFLEEFDDKTTPSTEGIKVLEKKMDEVIILNYFSSYFVQSILVISKFCLILETGDLKIPLTESTVYLLFLH